ncbi:MAG: hypothetical protein D6726_09870, partial [Nitrospirae bacterium]
MRQALEELLFELKAIAAAQIEAVERGMIDRLFELQDKRTEIIENIQKIDTEDGGSWIDNEGIYRHEESQSSEVALNELITEILEMDREIKERVRGEMNGILGRLHKLQTMKEGFFKSQREGRL